MIGYIYLSLILLIAYLVGSLPIGFWIARLRGVTDIRNHGSGNIGATNVARLLGGRYFVFVFFLDAFKAYIFLQTVAYYGFDYIIVLFAAAMIVIGNGCSIFLRGGGGKGVSTMIGILLALVPGGAVVFCSIWLVVLLLLRDVGIASVLAALVLPWYVIYISCDIYIVGLIFFISLWIPWRHWKNIQTYLKEGEL